MNEPGDRRPQILVAVDGTPSSMRAGAYAVSLARRQGGRLLCLYVHSPSVMLTANVPGLDVAIRETKETIAEELHELLIIRAGVLGLDARFIERSGNPYAEIVRAADEMQADTIVVGASTQAGHRVIGSVGARLIRTGRWPVTVVP